MGNQNTQTNPDESNPENASFYDQADVKFNKAIQKAAHETEGLKKHKMEDYVTSDDDENAGEIFDKHYMNRAEAQVRENEDASLQDDTYSFDEANTDDEEFHDVDVEDFDLSNDDDFVQ